MALDDGRSDITNKAVFARLWNSNTSVDHMAEIFGCRKERVYAAARRHNLRPRNPQGRVITIHKRDFRKMWDNGTPVAGIASELRCTGVAVQLLADYFDLGPRNLAKIEPAKKQPKKDVPPVPGGPFWTARRDDQVRETDGRYQQVSALAAELGVASSSILGRWHRLRAAG